MKPAIEFYILDYLRFSEQTSVESSNWLFADEPAWKSGLAFTDSAGLSLHLRDRLMRRNDFGRLPVPVQIELERRQTDNGQRTHVMLEEFVELNRRLQDAGIRYLNLKGFLLAPDFVELLERRAQYDYDFLVKKEDLQRACTLFLQSGYSALHSTRELAADHLPTLIQKTGWEWRGNYYDPAIPRGVELHFQLWESDFELLPIQTLDKVWERSCSQTLGSIEAPALCREDTLLYVTLHAFRHLLRNDLRLSHLYEIAYFLEHTSDQTRFWEDVVAGVTRCRNTTKIAATTFELARSLFCPALSSPVRHFIERHLPATAASWLRAYGRTGAVHCYRKNRNALLLHLALLDNDSRRWALVRQRLLPRHLPLPTYGVQIPHEAQSLGFRVVKAARYLGLLLQRGLFHIRSLTELCFQLPVWLIQLQRHRRTGERELGAK
ncbi:MAG: nucleotidyltransferase family protein [Terriglobia bacterium]